MTKKNIPGNKDLRQIYNISQCLNYDNEDIRKDLCIILQSNPVWVQIYRDDTNPMEEPRSKEEIRRGVLGRKSIGLGRILQNISPSYYAIYVLLDYGLGLRNGVCVNNISRYRISMTEEIKRLRRYVWW